MIIIIDTKVLASNELESMFQRQIEAPSYKFHDKFQLTQNLDDNLNVKPDLLGTNVA